MENTKNILGVLLLSFVIMCASVFVVSAQDVTETAVNAPVSDVSPSPQLYSPVTDDDGGSDDDGTYNDDDGADPNDDDEVISTEPNSGINIPITDKKIQVKPINTPISNGEKVISDSSGSVDVGYEEVQWVFGGSEGDEEETDSGKIYIRTSKDVAPKVQSAIINLEVKPLEIFSPVFSGIENLVVDPEIVDDKVIYNLEVKDVSKPIFMANEVLQPIFDLRLDQPVEFKLVDNKIIVNNEQIIDYKEIVRKNEVMPPVEVEIQSVITDGKVYDLKVIPCPESAEFKFIHREKEVMMPIYSDFKVEDKKLYLIHNEKVHNLKVNPPEIYSAIYDLRVEEPKIVVKELSLKVENEKPIYDLRVEEPFKLFWIIPMKINTRYVIDPVVGNIVDEERPWYSKLGRFNPLNLYDQLWQ
jgi:hypothetical protein